MSHRQSRGVALTALFLLLSLGISGALSVSLGPTVSLRLAPGAARPGIPSLDLHSLSFDDALTFVQGLQNGDSIDIPFPGGAGLEDLDLLVEVTFDLTTRSIDFVGTGSLGNLPEATLLLTAVWPDDVSNEPDIILGVRSSDFALLDLGLPGTIGDIEFPEVAFILPAPGGGGGSLPSSALSPNLEQLLAQAFPDQSSSPGFELSLDAGLQFAGNAPLDRLPDRVREILVAAAGAEVGFEGSLGLDFQLLRGEVPVSVSGFELTATLPELGPVAELDWVSTDPLSPTTLYLAYLDPAWEIEIGSTLIAEVGGDARAFDVSATLDLNDVGAALHLEGSTADPWDAPFGASGISLETVLLELDIDDAGEIAGAVTARVGVMPIGDLGELMLGAVQSAGLNLQSIDLPEIDSPTIEGLELTLSGGSAGVGLSASASIAFLGKQSTLFFSVVRDFDQNMVLLTGIELPDFGLSDLGFDGPLSGFEFPSSSFVLPRIGGTPTGPIKISANGLPDRILGILRDSYPDAPQCECEPPPGESETPEFVLDLSPGVNLAGTVPVNIVANALPGLRKLLGTTQDAQVLFEGALGLDLSIFSKSAPSIDLDTLELRLSVAGLAPNLLPSWLEGDPSQPTRFHVLYQNPNLSAELESGVKARIDGAFRTFHLASAIDLTSGSESLTLAGVMSSNWQEPFGISWLDLDQVGITLSAGAGAGAGGSFSGELSSSFTLGNGPLAKDLAIAIQLEVGQGGQVGGEVWAQANSLGIADIEALLTKVGSPLPIPDLPNVGIQNVQIALGGDNSGPSFTLMGTATVPGLKAEADMLFSLLSPNRGGGSARIITGFQLRDFGLGQLVPALDGTLVGDFELPSLNLVLSGGGSGGGGTLGSRIQSDDLSTPARSFFSSVYGTPDFDLSLSSGVNLMAALPDLGPALGQALDTLGANGGAVLQGSIPTPIPGFGAGGGLDVSLRAELPPMSPSLPNGAKPPWFRWGKVAFFIEIGAGNFAAGLIGELGVIIDDTDLDFYIAGEFGGPPIAITLAGGMIAPEPWEQPFGIRWLTIEELGLNMSFQPVTQSLGLGFIGRGVIVEKDLSVAGDLAISLSTGVPTNFVFAGESQSSFGLSDLAAIQRDMRTAAYPDDPPPTPLDLSKLGDVQIKPVSAEQPIEIKFALRRSPNVDPGFALAGSLWATTSPTGPLQELGTVAASLGIEGVFLFANVPQDLSVGEFSLADPTVDIDLVPIPPRASFFVAGDVDTPWSTKHVEIDLGGDGPDVLGAIGAVLDDAKALADGLKADAVNALRTSLTKLLATAEANKPHWLDPLLAAINEVEGLVTGVTPEQLLGYALAGVQVGSPQGIPSSGVSKVCPASTPFYEEGRCWSLPPSLADDIGYQLECPILTVESGGKCWVLPTGPPRYASDSFPETCGTWPVTWTCCTGLTRILENNRCWLVPPSVTASVPKISICIGAISGDKCLEATLPPGGADRHCLLATPIEDGDRCYTVPPNVYLDVGNVCGALNIGCSVDEFISKDVVPTATKATNDKLDEYAPPPPPNAAPVADAGAFYDVEEGDAVWLNAEASFDPEGAEVEVRWDLDGDEVFETDGVAARFDAAELNGPDLIEVEFEVSDGEVASRAAALVIVANSAPDVSLPLSLHFDSAEALAYTAGFEDPGPDSWDATIDFGDGTVSEVAGVDPATGVQLLHTYAEDGGYDLRVEVTDSDGG
ncbi:MAG: hypothetical protein JRH01_24065, partial [Deltaproteobacteria bacterium]|nr:hypothetical protein [Deltaproteobacteria bacterium]